MDILTLVGYAITALIGLVGGYAMWGKAAHILSEVKDLLVSAVEAIEDGSITKAELQKIIQDCKELAEAFK